MPFNENFFVITIQDNMSVIRNNNYNFMFGLIFEDRGEDEVKKEIERLLA